MAGGETLVNATAWVAFFCEKRARKTAAHLSKQRLGWLGDDGKAAQLAADCVERLLLLEFDRAKVAVQEQVAHRECIS